MIFLESIQYAIWKDPITRFIRIYCREDQQLDLASRMKERLGLLVAIGMMEARQSFLIRNRIVLSFVTHLKLNSMERNILTVLQTACWFQYSSFMPLCMLILFTRIKRVWVIRVHVLWVLMGFVIADSYCSIILFKVPCSWVFSLYFIWVLSKSGRQWIWPTFTCAVAHRLWFWLSDGLRLSLQSDSFFTIPLFFWNNSIILLWSIS